MYGARSLLDRIKPLIFSGLLGAKLRNDAVLRRLSAISLCKYMTVSKRFCQENLQLLFSVLFPKSKEGAGALSLGSSIQELEQDAEGVVDRSNCSKGAILEDLTLRQSLLVAVGDLLFRHPNVVEPWTDRLYAALGGHANESSDGSAAMELRLTALLVLTHLVLNDMMKARAVLLVRALWLAACTHEPTARVARILFQELSKRTTNIVYNLLPEIIARLPEHKAAAGSVVGGTEGRVRYIMQFIDKEKHIEGLIEKLSVRLEQSANVAGGAPAEGHAEMQAVEEESPGHALETVSCLANALGAMNYTDRCIIRLHDVVVVRKALNISISYHSVVRENLLAVVERARKPRPGKEGKDSKDAATAAPAPADSEPTAEGGEKKGGVSAAVANALDSIEQTVNALGKGKKEDDEEAKKEEDAEEVKKEVKAEPVAEAEQSRKGRGKGKRKAEDEQIAAPESEEPAKQGKGASRGKAAGRAVADGKENKSRTAGNAALDGSAIREAMKPKAKRSAGAPPTKRRRGVQVDDDAD